MEKKSLPEADLQQMRISLGLKLFVAVWSFIIAVRSESQGVSLLYLGMCILFAGLFIFQLQYYRDRKKAEEDSADESPHRS